MKLTTLLLCALTITVLSSCAHYREAQARSQERWLKYEREHQEDGNVLSLVGAEVLAREILDDPTSSAKDKAEARAGAYEAAYRYGRATGMTRRGSRKLARAVVSGEEDKVDLSCRDWEAAMQEECRAEAAAIRSSSSAPPSVMPDVAQPDELPAPCRTRAAAGIGVGLREVETARRACEDAKAAAKNEGKKE